MIVTHDQSDCSTEEDKQARINKLSSDLYCEAQLWSLSLQSGQIALHRNQVRAVKTKEKNQVTLFHQVQDVALLILWVILLFKTITTAKEILNKRLDSAERKLKLKNLLISFGISAAFVAFFAFLYGRTTVMYGSTIVSTLYYLWFLTLAAYGIFFGKDHRR